MIFTVNDGKRIIAICETFDAVKKAIVRNHLTSENVNACTHSEGEYKTNAKQTELVRQCLKGEYRHPITDPPQKTYGVYEKTANSKRWIDDYPDRETAETAVYRLQQTVGLLYKAKYVIEYR